jgi:hypothetical protein
MLFGQAFKIGELIAEAKLVPVQLSGALDLLVGPSFPRQGRQQERFERAIGFQAINQDASICSPVIVLSS